MQTIDVLDIERQVLAEMAAHGIIPSKSTLKFDTPKPYRFHVEGDKCGSTDGWCQIYTDGRPAGTFGHWKYGSSIKWRFDISDLDKATVSKLEKTEASPEVKARRAERERQEMEDRRAASARANTEYKKAGKPDEAHPYLARKKVGTYGDMRQLGETLIFPWRDIVTGELVTIQRIYPQVNPTKGRDRDWFPGAPKRGGYLIAPDVVTGPVIICEGAATGLSIYEALSEGTVIAAGDRGSLKQAAEAARKRWPDRPLFIAADDDWGKEQIGEGNHGMVSAQAVLDAGLVNGLLVPPFGRKPGNTEDKRSDWNDYAQEHSPDMTAQALRKQMAEAAMTPKEKRKETTGDELSRLLALRKTIDISIQLPPLEEIAGLFPRGGLSFLIAKAGTGKSWLVQRIASDLSVGGEILAGYAYSEPRTSLILAGEAGHEMLIRRGTSTRWPVDMNRLHVFDAFDNEHEGLALDIDTKDGQRRLKLLTGALKPDLLFLDSLVAFHTTDENSSEKMRPVYGYLNALAREANIAVVASHHVTKSKRSERKVRMDQDDAIGSSMLNRFAAAIIGVEETGDENEIKTILVSSKKARHRKPKSFEFQLMKDENGHDFMRINLDPMMGNGTRDRILNFIETTYAPGECFSATDIQANIRVSRSYLVDCLNAWIDNGTLIREGTTNRVKYMLPFAA